MLLTPNGNPQSSGTQAIADIIFDADVGNFQKNALEASMSIPILVDFWAPWCGPCKQLTPILESVVQSYKGAVKLAKVNLDDNPELAQAFRVQSVPTVYALYGGQPVDGFQGVVPESSIRALIDKILQAVRQSQPEAQNIEEAIKQAEEMLSSGQPDMALAIYQQILQQESDNAPAYGGVVKALLALGQTDQAESLLQNAPESIVSRPELSSARIAIELTKDAPSESIDTLKHNLEKKPDDKALRFDLAKAMFSRGQSSEAIDHLLKIVEQDRAWNEEAARKQLLKIFEALGQTHPLTIESRKKLSSLLFL